MKGVKTQLQFYRNAARSTTRTAQKASRAFFVAGCRIRAALAPGELRLPSLRLMLQPKKMLPFWAEQIRWGSAHSLQPPRVSLFQVPVRAGLSSHKGNVRTKKTLGQCLDRCGRAHYSHSANARFTKCLQGGFVSKMALTITLSHRFIYVGLAGEPPFFSEGTKSIWETTRFTMSPKGWAAALD